MVVDTKKKLCVVGGWSKKYKEINDGALDSFMKEGDKRQVERRKSPTLSRLKKKNKKINHATMHINGILKPFLTIFFFKICDPFLAKKSMTFLRLWACWYFPDKIWSH